MEVAAKNPAPVSFDNATLLEMEGELLKAALMYEKLLKKAPSDMSVLSRLMVIYRKQKDYRKEIIHISAAIKIHEQKYARLKSKNAKVVLLSKKLNTLLGHTDKRGKNLLDIPEVTRLKKRKEVAQKRMK
ncbi:MAG: hypothetical protein ABIQ31_22155 [Ferruginibacter sp.]